MNALLHIADRVLNRPLLITPDKAQVIMSVLAGRIGVNGPEMSQFEGDRLERDESGKPVKVKPYRVTDKGVGIITVTGSLVNRGAWLGANSGLTSYEGIQHQLKTAMGDSAVKSVVLDLHTPGGEGIGAFETAAMVRDLSATKRTIAIVNGQAASAGYAIASGATEIVTTESGMSGSIGVVLLHADISRKLANEGVNPTIIFAGAHKADGNPFGPLPDDVRSDLQAEVNNLYEAFLKTVGKGRGSRLTAAAARKTEARSMFGADAVAAGLADRIGTFSSVLSDLSRGNGRSTSQPRRLSMSENNGVPAAEENSGIPQATHDAAMKQSREEGRVAGLAEGHKAGAESERTRLASIINADGVKGDAGRLSASLDLATESPDMSADKIVAFAVKNVAETKAEVLAAASLAARNQLPDSLAATGRGTGKPEAVKVPSAASIYEDRRKARA